MKKLQYSRWLLLVVAVLTLSLPSFAGVFISVGFAPPALPVYDQPPCPDPDMLWTPGYWAYGSDGYYWVPGAWVPAPYPDALWTPGYWGWQDGLYVWHPGYWGSHVGYYGGVNYGFGFFGVGFVGGEWRDHRFFYNSAVMHVDDRRVRNVFMNRAAINNTMIINNNHTSFNGGPGGINHAPMPMERMADRDHHMAFTSFQQQHEMGARNDRGAYAHSNGGRPQNMVSSHPLGAESHAAPGGMNGGMNGANRPGSFAQQGPRGNAQGQKGFQNQQQGGPQQGGRQGFGAMQSPGGQGQQWQRQGGPQSQGQQWQQQRQGGGPQSQGPQRQQGAPQAQGQPQRQGGSQPQGQPQRQGNPQPQAQPGGGHPAAQGPAGHNDGGRKEWR